MLDFMNTGNTDHGGSSQKFRHFNAATYDYGNPGLKHIVRQNHRFVNRNAYKNKASQSAARIKWMLSHRDDLSDNS